MRAINNNQEVFLSHWMQAKVDVTNLATFLEDGESLGLEFCQIKDGFDNGAVSHGWLHRQTAQLFSSTSVFPLKMKLMGIDRMPSPFKLITETHMGRYEAVPNKSHDFILIDSAYFYADQLSDRGSTSDDRLVGNCPFSIRTINCLMNAGIQTVGQLRQIDSSELLEIKNFGRTCLQEVIEFLKGNRTPEKILRCHVGEFFTYPSDLEAIGIESMWQLCEKTNEELRVLGISISKRRQIKELIQRCGLEQGMKSADDING